MAEIPTEWLYQDTLGPGEVAKIFNVDSRTVTKWAQAGLVGFFRTPHGARRYPESEVRRMMAGDPAPEFVKELADADNEKYGAMYADGWHNSQNPIFQKNRPKDAA